MKVDGSKTVGPAGAAHKKRRSDGGDFAGELDDVSGREDTPSTGAVSASRPAESLWALQAVEDFTADRRQAVARGEDLLDRLDDLRRDIIAGRISIDRLQRLSERAQTQRAQVDDPRLAAVLDEIDLRAQVELAKWRRDG